MGRTLVSPEIGAYTNAFVNETEVLRRLREETARMSNAVMQIGPDQGAFFTFLMRTIGAKRALEVGTFTGYSSIAIASGLPEDGKLVCCDVSDEWTQVARRYWKEAGLASRIELKLGPAQETLEALARAGESFDFAFIDADKQGYDAYYELCLKLVRKGGLIALDNMLWSGAVTRPDKDADTAALHALNQKIRSDARVEASLLTIGDGVLLARKR